MCTAASNNTKEVLQWFLRPPWEGKNWFQDPLTLPSLLLVCINIFPPNWIQLPHDFTHHIGLLLPVYKISYIWHIWLFEIKKEEKRRFPALLYKLQLHPMSLYVTFFHGWGRVECIIHPLGGICSSDFILLSHFFCTDRNISFQKYDDWSFLQS